MTTATDAKYRINAYLHGVAHIATAHNRFFGVVTFECGKSARLWEVSSCSMYATTCKSCERIAAGRKDGSLC